RRRLPFMPAGSRDELRAFQPLSRSGLYHRHPGATGSRLFRLCLARDSGLMINARDIFDAWEMVRESGMNPFADDAAVRMPAVRGWAALGMPGNVTPPGPSTWQAFRAIQLAVTETSRGSHRVELVATTPLGPGACATT